MDLPCEDENLPVFFPFAVVEVAVPIKGESEGVITEYDAVTAVAPLPELKIQVPRKEDSQVVEEPATALLEEITRPGPVVSVVPKIEQIQEKNDESSPLSTESVTVHTENRELVFLFSEGEPAEIILDGYGWVYQDEDSPGSYRLIERNLGAEETCFDFSFQAPGDYTLSFMNQDLKTGGFSRLNILVSVLRELPQEETADLETEEGQEPVLIWNIDDFLRTLSEDPEFGGRIEFSDLWIAYLNKSTAAPLADTEYQKNKECL